MPAKKKATTEAAAVEVAPEKKPVRKRTAKTAAVKPAETTAKKTVRRTKKTAPAKEYLSVQKYKDVINWKKGEAHAWNWLYIEVNAGDLLTELEAGADNMAVCVEAIKDCMLEGDFFITEADDAALSVRYYTDNLNEWRRKYSEVNG